MLCGSIAYASKKPIDPSSCKTFYSIVQRDVLGNLTQGAPKNDLKWVQSDLQKKYPTACYAPPDPSITTVLFISVERAVYNGTQTVTHNSSSHGTVSDTSGDVGSYHGTNTSAQEVPYSVDYGRFMLTVESIGQDSKVTVRRRFQQDGLYSTMYGIPLGGRGHHPTKALIEDAVKWIASGGLSDPLQSSQ